MDNITFEIAEMAEQLGAIDTVTGVSQDNGPWTLSGILSVKRATNTATKTCTLYLTESQYRKVLEDIDSLQGLVRKA